MHHSVERDTVYNREIEILDTGYQDQLKTYIHEIEEILKRPGLGEILFLILNELITNAIRANLKRIFFLKRGYSYEDEQEYRRGLLEFKTRYADIFKLNPENLSSAINEEWLEAIRDLSLKVRVKIDLNRQRLLIFVINNALLHPFEEKKIRKNLSVAMRSKDIPDFLVNYGITEAPSLEGEGLGLPLIVFLIREAGFQPEYFRVYRENQSTVARLEFPLSEDYIPLRELWKKKQNAGNF